MLHLPGDILREILEFLDPLNYRNFRRVSKRILEISRSPIRSYLIYKSSNPLCYWKARIDRLGYCHNLSYSHHEYPLDRSLNTEISSGSQINYKITFSLNSKGYVDGTVKLILKNPIYKEYIDVPFKEGIVDGMIYNITTGTCREISKGLPKEGHVELSLFRDNLHFVLIYHDRQVTGFNLHGEGRGVDVRGDESKKLCNLDTSLSKRAISVYRDNPEEVILPLCILNCWDKDKLSTDVEIFLRRLTFCVLSLVI